LLKTLEEPSEHTILFLITKDESLLPQTIVSRCQLVYFAPVVKEKIKLGFAAVEEAMLELSLGLPGRIKKWQEEKNSFTIYQTELERFKNLLGKSFFEKTKSIEELFKDNTDSIANRERLQTILDIWQLLVRDFCFNYLKLKELVVLGGVATPSGWEEETEKQIVDGKIFLGQNINPRLIFENILLTLP